MKFSIVTPSLNCGQYLKKTIDSVLDQEGKFDLEYLIMDGESTDNTHELVKKYDGQLDFISEKDEFPSDAITKGFERLDGDIFAWINADDYYEKDTFRKVQEVFESNPNVDWIYGYYNMVNKNGKKIRPLHAVYKKVLMNNYSFSLLLRENIFAQPSVFFRKNIIKQVLPLDYRSQNRTAFDYELWLKMAQISKPLLVKQVFSNFLYRSDSISVSQTKKLFQGQLAYAKLHGKGHPISLFIHQLNYFRNLLIYNLNL